MMLRSTEHVGIGDIDEEDSARHGRLRRFGHGRPGFYAGVMGGYAWNNVKGGFGGGTLGYNWQAPGSLWLFGIEVDAAGSAAKDSVTEVVFGVPVTVEDKIRAFGSVTGRVGVTAGAALFYA